VLQVAAAQLLTAAHIDE